MNQTFRNKTALITGASRGIGKAIALRLAAQGANIIVNFVRNEDAALKTVAQIHELGVPAKAVQANVGDPKAIESLVATSLEAFSSIDILVHCAALGAFKPVHKLKLNQFELSMDVNTQSFLLLVQKVLPSMEKSGGGNILTISSHGAHRFIPEYGAIGISKAALEALVRYLAVELAPKGVRVNCISGGLIDTDALKFFPNLADMKEEVLKKTAAGRIGTPEDIAKIAAFLLSPDSSWIVGQTIIADGGYSLI